MQVAQAALLMAPRSLASAARGSCGRRIWLALQPVADLAPLASPISHRKCSLPNQSSAIVRPIRRTISCVEVSRRRGSLDSYGMGPAWGSINCRVITHSLNTPVDSNVSVQRVRMLQDLPIGVTLMDGTTAGEPPDADICMLARLILDAADEDASLITRSQRGGRDATVHRHAIPASRGEPHLPLALESRVDLAARRRLEELVSIAVASAQEAEDAVQQALQSS